jgi:hypothetical protein
MVLALARPTLILLLLALVLSTAGAASAAPANTLPELPTAPSLELGKPEVAELAELDALLGRITGQDQNERDEAIREVLEAEPKLVPALAFRLSSIAEACDKEAMKAKLGAVRRKFRELEKDEESEDAKGKDKPGPDYLPMLASHPEPGSAPFRDLISVVAISRMLEHVGTIEATRLVVEVYVRFGEFLRVDTQRALARLGDKAVPALIEARRHQAEKISKWAVRQLDALGKGIPSEAVQTTNHQVLADVLRAYGRTRDPDALRIVVSFANNERPQVREFPRQAIGLMGEVGTWQLRDTFETIVGKKPPRDWTWERTARELFGEFDRLRSAEVTKLFEAGNKAFAAGDLEAMRGAYDKLLAQNPEFEKKQELLQGYLQYGKRFALDKPDRALLALRKAERLGAGGDLENRIKSLRFTIEAEGLADRHIADRILLKRAVELDPNNARAKEVLARVERGELPDDGKSRYLAAIAIAVVALIAIAFILLRRRLASDEPKKEKEEGLI